MFRKLAKVLLISFILVGALSVAEVADAHEADYAQHEMTGNLENTKGGICTNDWCIQDVKSKLELFCDESGLFADTCEDIQTFCKNNPDLEQDAHGKTLSYDGQPHLNCGVILGIITFAEVTTATGNLKEQAATKISELTETIKITGAGDASDPNLKIARSKLASAKQSQSTADGQTTDQKAAIFYQKAIDFANEGLQALGAGGAGAGAPGAPGGAAGRPGAAPAPSRVITGPGLVTPPGGIAGISGIQTAGELGVGIINFFLSFVGIIAVAMLIYGGFLYITGGADADKSGKGKKVIIGAVIGILVIIASWTIVNTLITLQGTTGGGGGAGGIVQANAVQVTISGTTLIGANVQGTVTVYQGQTATAQLSGSTVKGFISTPATIDVTLQGATVIIGDNVTLPAANTFQQEIDASGPLRKGKVNINILQ